MHVSRTMIAAMLLGAAVVMLVKGPPHAEIDTARASELEEALGGFTKQETPKVDTPGTRIKACLNDDAVIHSKITLWTMLIPQEDINGKERKGYIQAAKRLVKSAKRHALVDFDAMLLELEEKPLPESDKEELKEAGWGICVVKRIPPPDEEATFKHFRDQFTKFAIWNMQEVSTAVYLDADTYVVGDITPLLTTKLEGKKIGVGRDFMKKRGGWLQTFNMGVFLIHPNTEDYEQLMSYHRGEHPLVYDKHWSEQAFLNALWADKWFDLGFENNANLALYTEEPSFWEARAGNIRVVHYTMRKPWKNCAKTEYADVCKWWLEER